MRTCPSCGRQYAWWRRSCFHGIYNVPLTEPPAWWSRMWAWLRGERDVWEIVADVVAAYLAVAGSPADEHPGYQLLRVADEVLDKLEREGSEPVHILGVQRHDDGTIDLVCGTVAPAAIFPPGRLDAPLKADAWDEGFAAGQSHAWDSAQAEIDAIHAAGRAAATTDPPRTVLDPETGIEEPVTTGRIPDAEFVEPPLMPPAASPDERLREALWLIVQHARLDLSERGIAEAERYAVIAEDALAADREAPDEETHDGDR